MTGSVGSGLGQGNTQPAPRICYDHARMRAKHVGGANLEKRCGTKEQAFHLAGCTTQNLNLGQTGAAWSAGELGSLFRMPARGRQRRAYSGAMCVCERGVVELQSEARGAVSGT